MPDALPQAWLELADGRMHWLDAGVCTIGRAATNQLVLDVAGISRNHAVLQPGEAGGHVITDLHSTNGTYLNGLRLERSSTPLNDGDTIEIGGIKFIYRRQQGGDTPTPGAAAGATSVQIHSGHVWLLMLDLIGHTAHTHAVGAETASADFKRWIELVRPVLVRSGATINAYLGDALFAYWRQDRHPADKVAPAFREIVALQATSPRPFRTVLHYGKVAISGGLQGESLTGSDVIYLFRIEKCTKQLGSRCVLSEPAAKSLNLTAEARSLGSHPVPDYPGQHAFFSLG